MLWARRGGVQREHGVTQGGAKPAHLQRLQNGDLAGWEDEGHVVVLGGQDQDLLPSAC
ncbi:hypothetical protein GCM10010428_22930 [Actinosynnema pretiosum subsp. pretiosum]